MPRSSLSVALLPAGSGRRRGSSGGGTGDDGNSLGPSPSHRLSPSPTPSQAPTTTIDTAAPSISRPDTPPSPVSPISPFIPPVPPESHNASIPAAGATNAVPLHSIPITKTRSLKDDSSVETLAVGAGVTPVWAKDKGAVGGPVGVGGGGGAGGSRGWVSLAKRLRKRYIAGAALLLALIVMGIVVGVVVGRQKGKGGSKGSLGSESESPTIMNGTAVAAARCPDKTRWLFFQDSNNTIRVASSKSAGSHRYDWNVQNSASINVDARAKSPLSASCDTLPNSKRTDNYSAGNLVQLIYFNANNSLGHAYFSSPDDACASMGYNNGEKCGWNTTDRSQGTPALTRSGFIDNQFEAAPDSRLSLSSTVIRPPNLDDNGECSWVSGLFKNCTNFLSSVATYTGIDGNPVMIDLVGNTANETSANDDIPNLFEQFVFEPWSDTTELLDGLNTTMLSNASVANASSAATSFACSYNFNVWNVDAYADEADIDKVVRHTYNMSTWCVSPTHVVWTGNYTADALDQSEQTGAFYEEVILDLLASESHPINTSDIVVLPHESFKYTDWLYNTADGGVSKASFALEQGLGFNEPNYHDKPYYHDHDPDGNVHIMHFDALRDGQDGIALYYAVDGNRLAEVVVEEADEWSWKTRDINYIVFGG